MINLDYFKKENIEEHNPNWLQMNDHPCKLLIIRKSVSGKTSSLFNPITHQRGTDTIYLFAKDPYEAKY